MEHNLQHINYRGLRLWVDKDNKRLFASISDLASTLDLSKSSIRYYVALNKVNTFYKVLPGIGVRGAQKTKLLVEQDFRPLITKYRPNYMADLNLVSKKYGEISTNPSIVEE